MPPSHLAPLMTRDAKLPDALAARLPDWTAAADDLAKKLTDALGTEVTPEPARLAVKTPAQVRARKDMVVVPITDGALALSRTDAGVLAARLLRSEPEEAGAEAARPLDTLLMGSVAGEACAAVNAVFGTNSAPTGKPCLGWPPARPGAQNALCAALAFALEEHVFALRLVLDGPPETFAAEAAPAPAHCPRMAGAALEATAPLRAVLDSWTVTAGEAAGLRRGSVLALPGASIEALDVVLGLPGGPMRLASAELGRARGQQAVRLTTPVSFG